MSEFTASNGMIVTGQPDGLVMERLGMAGIHRVNGFEVAGLREFFVKENDDRLGRWRWPDGPEHVVYPQADGRVLVLNESDADFQHFSREEAYEIPGLSYRRAARAFFDAHPEPKPWHEAKAAEIWALTTMFGTHPFVVVAGGRVGEEYIFRPTHRDPVELAALRLSASAITDGHRIWPEVQS